MHSMIARAAIAAAATAGAAGLLGAGTAGASVHPNETAACDAAAGLGCAGIVDQTLVPNLALSVSSGTPVSGSPLVAAAPASIRRQDFIVSTPFADNTLTTIRWAPRGVGSNLCVTSHSDNGTAATFTRCRGIARQSFREVPGVAPGDFVLVCPVTGLALRIDTATGEVLNKDPGQGTGANEQFTLRVAV